METKHKKSETKDEIPEKNKSDKILIWSIILLIIVVISFFSVAYFFKQPFINTIEDLNKLNIEGELESDEGYLYNGVYSFVKLGGLWYTQLKSPSGNIEYNVPFHFGPRDVEDLKTEGFLDERFTEADEVYITFNPLGTDLTSVALAVGEFDQSLITTFGKKPIASCDRNETEACKERPIVTCEDKDKAVAYFKEDENTRIIFSGNCITIQGQGLEIVRAVDRILLKWLGIMG